MVRVRGWSSSKSNPANSQQSDSLPVNTDAPSTGRQSRNPIVGALSYVAHLGKPAKANTSTATQRNQNSDEAYITLANGERIPFTGSLSPLPRHEHFSRPRAANVEPVRVAEVRQAAPPRVPDQATQVGGLGRGSPVGGLVENPQAGLHNTASHGERAPATEHPQVVVPVVAPAVWVPVAAPAPAAPPRYTHPILCDKQAEYAKQQAQRAQNVSFGLSKNFAPSHDGTEAHWEGTVGQPVALRNVKTALAEIDVTLETNEAIAEDKDLAFVCAMLKHVTGWHTFEDVPKAMRALITDRGNIHEAEARLILHDFRRQQLKALPETGRTSEAYRNQDAYPKSDDVGETNRITALLKLISDRYHPHDQPFRLTMIRVDESVAAQSKFPKKQLFKELFKAQWNQGQTVPPAGGQPVNQTMPLTILKLNGRYYPLRENPDITEGRRFKDRQKHMGFFRRGLSNFLATVGGRLKYTRRSQESSATPSPVRCCNAKNLYSPDTARPGCCHDHARRSVQYPLYRQAPLPVSKHDQS